MSNQRTAGLIWDEWAVQYPKGKTPPMREPYDVEESAALAIGFKEARAISECVVRGWNASRRDGEEFEVHGQHELAQLLDKGSEA